LKKAQETETQAPSIFKDENLESFYGMLDPSSKGYISFNQYSEGIKFDFRKKKTIIIIKISFFFQKKSFKNTWNK
jgi:hypothetical protein